MEFNTVIKGFIVLSYRVFYNCRHYNTSLLFEGNAFSIESHKRLHSGKLRALPTNTNSTLQYGNNYGHKKFYSTVLQSVLEFISTSKQQSTSLMFEGNNFSIESHKGLHSGKLWALPTNTNSAAILLKILWHKKFYSTVLQSVLDCISTCKQ